MDLLEFARGPAIQIALVIFLLGTIWRFAGILMLPWMRDLSKPRDCATSPFVGWLTANFRRMWPYEGLLKSGKTAAYTTINGYVFHLGLAIVVFGLAPHILFIKDLTGLSWPALPNNFIYAVGVITLASLVGALAHRLINPVLKLLSGFDDYFTWFVTAAPVFTGLLASSHLGAPYETLLAIHILSVALFLIWFPFGKLMHGFLFAFSRGATGMRFNHRGAKL